MRRITTLLAALLMALGLTAGPAVAMQPPGEGAQDNFGCALEDGDYVSDPVNGHPGASGLGTDGPSFHRVQENTEGTPAGDSGPTAWNAVDNSNPIEAGTCHKVED